jgi:hypothetical protein
MAIDQNQIQTPKYRLDPFIAEILALCQNGAIGKLTPIQKSALERALEDNDGLSAEDIKRIENALYSYEPVNVSGLVLPRFKEYIETLLNGLIGRHGNQEP